MEDLADKNYWWYKYHKDKKDKVQECKINSYAKENLIKITLWGSGYLVYKKVSKGLYKIFCTKCQRYELVDKKTLDEIIYAQICPMCFGQIKTTTKTEFQTYNFVAIGNNGYLVNVKFSFGHKPIATTIIHVAKWIDRAAPDDIEYKLYISHRYITINMGWWLAYAPYYKNWSKWKLDTKYSGFFYDYEQFVVGDMFKGLTKKQYYEEINKQSNYALSGLKSNQIKIAKDHIITNKMVYAMMQFDINDFDTLFKYRKYIKKECWTYYCLKTKLNVYHLDYLNRNNYRLGVYVDYICQCERLGIKPDKPKDLNAAHEKLSKILEQEEDMKIINSIKERYSKLKIKKYKSKNITIAPFCSYEQINQCANELHNCIADCYMEDYARGKTDLYHLNVDGKITIAIEVKHNQLKQALGKHNHDCPAKLMKHIKKWCQKNNWEIAYE